MLHSIRYIIAKGFKKILNPPAIKSSNIHHTSRVCSKSVIVNSTMGKYSYVASSSSIINTEIGSFCSISDYCIIGDGSHPIEWVSSSPVFHFGKNTMHKNFSLHEFNPYKNTKIGNDVWIGSNCLVKSGVTISDGAIIGMGSIVTKNIGPYEIWGGNPAKLIRKRFGDEKIKKLLDIRWWDFNEEKIMDNAKYFNDIDQFLIKIDES